MGKTDPYWKPLAHWSPLSSIGHRLLNQIVTYLNSRAVQHSVLWGGPDARWNEKVPLEFISVKPEFRKLASLFRWHLAHALDSWYNRALKNAISRSFVPAELSWLTGISSAHLLITPASLLYLFYHKIERTGDTTLVVVLSFWHQGKVTEGEFSPPHPVMTVCYPFVVLIAEHCTRCFYSLRISYQFTK